MNTKPATYSRKAGIATAIGIVVLLLGTATAEAKALLEAGQRDLALIKLDQALIHNPYHVLALEAREELCGTMLGSI